MRKLPSPWLLPALLASLFLVGCATGFPGTGYPSTGYPSGGYPSSYAQQVEGQVLDTDHRNGRFMLSQSGVYGDRYGSQYGGQRIEVYYQPRTRLVYQGRELSPQGLEPGDVIRVYGSRQGGRFNADRIDVLRDVRAGSPYGQPPYGGIGQSATIDGALRHIDTRNRIISLTRGGYTGPQEQVRYDARTRVEDRGRSLRVEQLRAGDVLRIQARAVSGGWLAEYIQVRSDDGRW